MHGTYSTVLKMYTFVIGPECLNVVVVVVVVVVIIIIIIIIININILLLLSLARIVWYSKVWRHTSHT